MNIYASSITPLIILVIIIGVAASIALVAFLIYRYMHPKIKQEEFDENKAAQEELERILQPIEDETIAEEVANYVDDKDE